MFMSRAKATPQRRPYFHALFLTRPMHLLLENGHLSLVTIEQMKSDICKSEKPLHSEWDWFKMTSKEKDLIQDNLMNENSPIKSYPFPETDHFQTKIFKNGPKETSTTQNRSTENVIKSKPKK